MTYSSHKKDVQIAIPETQTNTIFVVAHLITPLKFNVSPEKNDCLEDYFHVLLGMNMFSGALLNFQGV